MMASNHPVKAPRNASVIERLLKVRSPWPVRMNPVYAIATVQRITRTGCIGETLPQSPVTEQTCDQVANYRETLKRECPVTQMLSRTTLPREPLSGTIPQVVYDAPNYWHYLMTNDGMFSDTSTVQLY